MLKRLRLQGDCSFGSSQRFRASALLRQKNRVAADDLRVARILAQQAVELRGRRRGLARAAEHEGEDGARLPKLAVQLDRALQAAPALVEPAHFEQEIAEIEPSERLRAVQLRGASCQLHGGVAINGPATQFSIGKKVQGRSLGRFGCPTQEIPGVRQIPVPVRDEPEQMQRACLLGKSRKDAETRLTSGLDFSPGETLAC